MKTSKTNCNLNTCFLCKSCLKEWLPAVGANRKTIDVKKGERIFEEGDPVTGIYFVYSGMVKVHKKWGADKELILRIASPGTILGHRGLGTRLVYPVSGTALEPSVVCFLELGFFNATLKVNQELSYQMMLFFADELQESEKYMRDLVHMPVKGRVSRSLLNLAEKFGVNEEGFINIVLSRQDFASLTATTYETIFRIMNELIEEQCIMVKDKQIAIINRERLTGYLA